MSDEKTKVYILALDKESPKPYPADLLPYHGKELSENARDYMEKKNGDIEIIIKYVKTMPELWSEIESDAITGASLFDAYYTNPVSIGAATQLGGLMDFGPYIKSYPGLDWLDVLPAFRNHATNYEDKVQLILLDGDTHFMYYRRDVLDHFGLKVPRTWDEYVDVARAAHGKEYEGKTLSGSCIGRQKGDHAQFWYHLVHSTITQTRGTETGSLLDTESGKPLLGEALTETMRLHEGQVQYGSNDEFTGTLYSVLQHMLEGKCTLTYYWGDVFKTSKSSISAIDDKLGIAPTPGSTRVLDRETGKLVECTKQLCPFGKYYEDIGWVNLAPYIANGGWGGAVSANTNKEKQDILADFFLWSTSRNQSLPYVIPNATGSVLSMNTQDPWRKSHLDIDEWVKRGYDEVNAKMYVDTLLLNTNSKNGVVEMRFPKAGDLYASLDRGVFDHMYRFKQGELGGLSDAEKVAERMRVSVEIEREWTTVIDQYNNRGDTEMPLLQQYQILRGVYFPDENMNQLSGILPFGMLLLAIIYACAVGFGLWTLVHRKFRIVKASQPIFLGLICVGSLIMGSAILFLSIDDAWVEDPSWACMSVPWLVATGFTIAYAALFSKLHRINKLLSGAQSFRRVKIESKDVMMPFLALLSLNTIFLTVLTVVDPLYYKRTITGKDNDGSIESAGICTNNGTATGTTMISLIVIINGCALIIASVEAYKARKISIEFSESRYIASANICLLQAFLIGIPLIFLVSGDPVPGYFVKSTLIFIACMSILLFMFVPKILAQHRSGRRESDEARRSGLKVIGTWNLNRQEGSFVSATAIGRREGSCFTATASILGHEESGTNRTRLEEDQG